MNFFLDCDRSRDTEYAGGRGPASERRIAQIESGLTGQQTNRIIHEVEEIITIKHTINVQCVH